jgi:hypothetical protein
MYITLLQGTLKQVSKENLDTEPGFAWLLLIPLFSIIWTFIFYPRIASSLKKEFEARGENPNGDCGKGLGIALAITGVLSLIPYIGIVFAIGNLVIWIIYWVIIAKYKTRLEKGQASSVGLGSSSDLLDN